MIIKHSNEMTRTIEAQIAVERGLYKEYSLPWVEQLNWADRAYSPPNLWI